MEDPGEPGSPAATLRDRLSALQEREADSFGRGRILLSFDEWLEEVESHPERHLRNAAQYLLDAVESFGTREVETMRGPRTRWQVFDAPFDDGEDRVVGQEEAQAQLVSLLRNFVSERRINRLILLHGPNGSAKSSFVACLSRAMEAYSRTPQGALYTFHWIFPTRVVESSRLGFGGGGRRVSGESFAHLEDSQVDARVSAEHNDNPVFLLQGEQRQALLAHVGARCPSFLVSDTIRRGTLGHRSRTIWDALMTSYRGDVKRVLRHVQVERFFVSRAYRRAAVTVEPQLRVDAGVRQLTADRSLAALPTALQTQTLFETFGPLVEANRGLLEYNDLLKRPMEANRYLLSTSEKGTVALDHAEMRLDAVLIATGNELYLEAFKQQPDWSSYKGRMELVRMPYLLDWQAEQQVYDDMLRGVEGGTRVAPHTTAVLALWAVLTRLRRPDPAEAPARIRDVVRAMTPLQKARLLAEGQVPRGLAGEVARELRAWVPAMLAQGEEGSAWEGRFGASAREMKGPLLSRLHGASDRETSPADVLHALEAIVRDRTVYEWLSLEPEGAYRRPETFIADVAGFWHDRLEREVRLATRLVDDVEHGKLFDRYIMHIHHWLRGEKLVDPASGVSTSPDERLMAHMEEVLGQSKEDPRQVRSAVISQVAAFRIDHPDAAMAWERIFPRQLERLEEYYYQSQQRAVARICRNIVALESPEGPAMEPADEAEARATLARLQTEAGHSQGSALEAVSVLLRHRWADVPAK